MTAQRERVLMPDAARIIEAMARLPVVFHEGELSPQTIVREGGLAEGGSAVTVAAMREYLAAHPELLNEWRRWSMDKRTGQGWTFFENLPRWPWQKRWGVAHFSRPGKRDHAAYSDDPYEACAIFVLREVESLVSTSTFTASRRRS